jgi:hypothetical protein
VTDTATGLTWKRCSEGQSWDGATCAGSAMYHTWQQALQVADTASYAGQSDWRLPNAKELASIVEQACYSPAIDEAVFPATPSSYYWSSSPGASNAGRACPACGRAGRPPGWWRPGARRRNRQRRAGSVCRG